ncbi:hypothetical protein [Desulfoluna butyratoxydans]|uniref:hypothetical protein n=1 Tax=Desulfoluna butyratoxydans TaxID=231438 RepID=UPI0015D20FBC|nr:hypothetical protein [Desulfoluna butyratoxydans]
MNKRHLQKKYHTPQGESIPFRNYSVAPPVGRFLEKSTAKTVSHAKQIDTMSAGPGKDGLRPGVIFLNAWPPTGPPEAFLIDVASLA